jgi:sugar phosphate isomerase/epimerase
MKLGVIADGISRDFEHALKVMTEAGLEYVELQFLWDKEVGDQTPEEIQRIRDLITEYKVKASCISRHNFSGLPVMATEPEDEIYKEHMEYLKRCINIAKELGTDMVRIMSCRKEMIIFGYNGADQWVASTGSWDRFLKLMEPPVKLAEDEDITLVVETGNNAMVTSGVAYEEIKDYIGHIHLKDCEADIARATVRFCPLGTGDVAPYLEGIAEALKKDKYQGVISLESVYRPDNGTFEDGFRECLPVFRRLFGN